MNRERKRKSVRICGLFFSCLHLLLALTPFSPLFPLLGAKALLPHLPTGALVLNLDNVGRGELFYAEGEGMLLFFPYRGPLLEAARKTPGARPVRYRLAYFDTLPLTQRGSSCLTLVRLEGGLPPDWHWPTDTFARLDEGALEGTLVYARSLLEKVFRES
jgi:hypothetical protein